MAEERRRRDELQGAALLRFVDVVEAEMRRREAPIVAAIEARQREQERFYRELIRRAYGLSDEPRSG